MNGGGYYLHMTKVLAISNKFPSPPEVTGGGLLNEENTQIIGSFLFPYPPEITNAYYTDKYASEVSNLEDFSSPREANGVSYSIW